MRSKASFAFFTAAVVLVPAMAMTACSDDDDPALGPSTLLDGSADGRSNADGAVVTPDGSKPDTGTPIEAGKDTGAPAEGGADAGHDADATVDASTPDADASSTSTPDADAATTSDASSDADADAATTPTTLDDGTFEITAWTCGAKDIKAYATSIGIAEVDFTLTGGTAGQIDSIYSGTPACTRSSAFTATYPAPGTFTTTTAPAYTCSATCAPAKCTAGAQTVLIDTFAFTKTATTFTGTRTMDAASVSGTLQAAAGCQVGDLETATYTKK